MNENEETIIVPKYQVLELRMNTLQIAASLTNAAGIVELADKLYAWLVKE